MNFTALHRAAGAEPGGFFDDELADLLGLDGVHEFPVYALLVGRPADAGALRGAGGEAP